MRPASSAENSAESVGCSLLTDAEVVPCDSRERSFDPYRRVECTLRDDAVLWLELIKDTARGPRDDLRPHFGVRLAPDQDSEMLQRELFLRVDVALSSCRTVG
jgi:hypothetical protein